MIVLAVGPDFVAEELDAYGLVDFVGREDLDDIATNAKGPTVKVDVVALVMHGDESPDQDVAIERFAHGDGRDHAVVGLGRADAVDAGDAGHDDHVSPTEQRVRGRMAHAVDLVVDRRVLLDVRIGARYVGLGLVVVVVGDEIFDGIAGKEGLEFSVELGRERLVVRQNEGRPLHRGDDVGDREGLAAARDPEQDLVGFSVAQALDQGRNGLGLAAAGHEIAHEFEGSIRGDRGLDQVFGIPSRVVAGEPRLLGLTSASCTCHGAEL